MEFFRKRKIKTIIIICVSFFIISQGLLWGGFVNKSKAMGPVTDTETHFWQIEQIIQQYELEAQRTAKITAKEVKVSVGEKIKQALMRTAAITLKNTLIYFVQEAGRQTLQYVATGEWGEGPMFYEKTFDFFKDTVIGAATQEMMDELAYGLWQETGFDICDPDIEVKMAIMLNLQLGLPNPAYERVAPRCDYNKVRNNWETFYTDIRTNIEDTIAQTYGTIGAVQESLDPKQNDFGVFMSVLNQNMARQEEQYERERDDRMAPSKLKDKRSLVTGGVETPSFIQDIVVRSDVEAIQSSRVEELKSGQAIITEIPEQVLAAFIQSFGPQNFLIAFLNRLKLGLVKRSSSYNPVQQIYEHKKAIQKVNTEILTADFSFEPRDISLIDEFVNCPAEGDTSVPRAINDCVMDRNFSEAVRRSSSQNEAMTVQQAINEGLLDPNKPFVAASDPRNNDVNCYKTGYCYSNLKKLRKARIIPIGWEIAAEKTATYGNITLQQIIAAFNDENSAFYRLVDPNWVLKEPITQCRAKVNGPDLIGIGAADRSEVCADYINCIEETPNGDCIGGYGYCAEEERTWRLEGDSCESQYAGCKTLYDRNGIKQSWISNTMDPAGCDASSVGCRAYSLWKDMTAGTWAKTTIDDNEAVGYNHWIYLNSNVEDEICSPESEGCTRFIRTAADLGTNLLINSDFENIPEDITDFTDVDGVDGWNDNLHISQDIVHSGENSAYLDKDNITSEFINIVPKDYNRYFVLSTYLNKIDANSSLKCELQISDGVSLPVNLESFMDSGSADAGIWARKSWLYSLPADSNTSVMSVYCYTDPAVSPIVYMDDMQLEEVFDPTSFATYIPYGAANAIYQKQAPDYYNCYDNNPNNDDISCDDFAAECSADEVGCETYSPTDLGDSINAVVGRYNYCPAECNGYQSYLQSETFFEPEAFPLYFIPTTAQTCDAENVGCESYTNLDELAQGGEAVNSFKKIRQCSKPNDNCSPFYTWEGSEVSGYQIQTYSLIDADKDGDPDITDPGLDICNETIFNLQIDPDCRQYYGVDQNEETVISYHSASLTITCAENCSPHRLEVDAADIAASQQKCTSTGGTWDSNVNKCLYNIIPEEAVVCPVDQVGCREYKGNFSGDVEVIYDENFEDGLSGWTSNQTNANISYSAEAIVIGGHSMKVPATVTATYVAPSDDAPVIQAGEQYTLSFWVKPGYPENFIFDDSPDAQMKIEIGITDKQSSGYGYSAFVDFKGEEWNIYTISFTYDLVNDGYLENIIITNPFSQLDGLTENDYSFFVDNIKISNVNQLEYLIKNSWNTPTSCDTRLDSFEPLPQAMLGCREYQDRVGTLHYLRSFHKFCDNDAVGCEAVLDTQNSEYYGEEILNQEPIDVCQVDIVHATQSVGIECRDKMLAYICQQTQIFNQYATFADDETVFDVAEACIEGEKIKSNEELEQDTCVTLADEWDKDIQWIDGVGCLPTKSNDWYKVAADELVYRVIGDKTSCTAEEKGCTAAAQALLDFEWGISDWFETYIKIDPDKLEGKFCDSQAISCEEYVDDDNNVYFYKNPGIRYCEYRAENQTGWYQAGSDLPCLTWIPYQDGNEVPVPKTNWRYGAQSLAGENDSLGIQFTGWAAQCPDEANTCTAFIDPASKTDSNSIGKAYYVKNNEKVDRESCNGMVDPRAGCVLFNDTSSPDGPKWNSDLSGFENSIKGQANAPISIDGNIDINYYIDSLISTGISVQKNIKEISEYYDWLSDSEARNNAEVLQLGSQSSQYYIEMSSQGVDYNIFNDSNVVLRVNQDRQCSKWYTCLGPSYVWDRNAGRWTEICELIGLCDQYGRQGGGAYCKHVVLPEESTDNPLNQQDYFTAADYQSRKSAKYPFLDLYYDMYTPEYSGLSLVDNVPLQFLKPVDIDTSQEGDHYTLIAPIDIDPGQSCIDAFNDMIAEIAPDLVGTLPSDPVREISGQCYIPQHIYDTLNNSTPERWPETKLCRAYPEEDSPFPVDAVFESLPDPDTKSNEVRKNKFREAEYFGYNLLNMSPEEKATDYGCRYKDIKYGRGHITLHLPPHIAAPQAICDQTQKPCECLDASNPDNPVCNVNDCPGEQSCLQKELSLVDLYGWEGYCLEEDESTYLYADEQSNPCMTWYPVDMTTGLSDHFNQYSSAGFSSNELPYYCLTARPYMQEKAFFMGERGEAFLSWDQDTSCNADDSDYLADFWKEWIYELISEKSGDFSLETPDDKLYALSKDFAAFLSTAGEPGALGHIQDFAYEYGDDEWFKMGEIRREYLNHIISYYISNNDANTYGIGCPDGYFPIFAPCGKWEDLPGFGYDNGTQGQTGGVLCVPFNSYIDIPDEELTKWSEISPVGIDLSVFQGAECRPHITRGELLKKGSVSLASNGAACFNNSGAFPPPYFEVYLDDDAGEYMKVCGNDDNIRVETLYDLVVAMDNGYKVSWPKEIPYPDFYEYPFDQWENSYKDDKKRASDIMFALRRSDTGSDYFWEIRDETQLKSGAEEYLQGVNSSDLWKTATSENGYVNMNFDFMLPLYRYCVQKTPVIDTYKIETVVREPSRVTYDEDEHDFGSTTDGIVGSGSIATAIEHPAEGLIDMYGMQEAPDLAKLDNYLDANGHIFTEGRMLCDQLAEVENPALEDKAWTNRLYEAFSPYNQLPDISDVTSGGDTNNDYVINYAKLRYFAGTTPFQYGLADMSRMSADNSNDIFVPSASCSIKYNSSNPDHPTDLRYRAAVNPRIGCEFAGEDDENCQEPYQTEIVMCEEGEQFSIEEYWLNEAKSYSAFSIRGKAFDSFSGYTTSLSKADNPNHAYDGTIESNFQDYTRQYKFTGKPWTRLKELFAKVYDVWRWQSVFDVNEDKEKYRLPTDEGAPEEAYYYRSFVYRSEKDKEEADYSADESFDLVKSGGYSNTIPVITGVELRPDKKYRAVPDTITLLTESERANGGQIGLGSNNRGQLVVTAQFFAWANSDHMPIKRIQTHWGDGLESISGGATGQYKNYHAVCANTDGESIGICAGGESEETCYYNDDCSTFDCNNSTEYKIRFGAIPNACSESYIQKSHVYSCLEDNGLNLPEVPGCSSDQNAVPVSTGCWDPDYVDPTTQDQTGACVYRPGAQVLDNWGWCNGDCEGSGAGCYNDNDIFHYCDEVVEAYTRFNGAIIVVP